MRTDYEHDGGNAIFLHEEVRGFSGAVWMCFPWKLRLVRLGVEARRGESGEGKGHIDGESRVSDWAVAEEQKVFMGLYSKNARFETKV